MFFSRRVFTGVLVACVVHAASGQSVREGWTVTMRMSSDSGGGPPRTTTMRMQTSGQHVRIEMLGGAAAKVTGSGYMLATAGDSSLTTVTPARRTSMTMSSGLGRDAMPRVEATEAKVDRVEKLGPGETLLGHATTRYRITESWTTKVALANDSCARHVTRTAEMWIATDVDLTGALEQVAKALGRSGPVDNTDALRSARSERMPKGTALRTVAKSSDASGAAQKTNTTEIVELTHAALDTMLFVVPADYQRIDQAAIMAMVPRGTVNAQMRDIAQMTMRAMCGRPKSP
jgi:hypothetical protein